MLLCSAGLDSVIKYLENNKLLKIKLYNKDTLHCIVLYNNLTLLGTYTWVVQFTNLAQFLLETINHEIIINYFQYKLGEISKLHDSCVISLYPIKSKKKLS